MIRNLIKLCKSIGLHLGVAFTLAVVWATPGFAAPHDAALSGVVRDVQGVPQMGALVQILSADATVIATAFTDNHGRYLIPSVLPGKYDLKATAAFFMPTQRTNVRLQAGAQAIINLTMSTLYQAENWLPAQKRRADEPADDWKWTLRSSANRPLLRMVDDSDSTVFVSSSADSQRKASTNARVSVTSGDGGFGQGGVHQVLVIDRTMETGDGAILRADIGGPRIPFPVAPAAEIVAGYERRSPFGGSTRLVTSYQSHPELVADGSLGAQIMRMASTQEFKLGDMIVLDAGALLKAERLHTTRFSQEPFFRLMIRPANGVVVEYRFASGRELQSSEDLDHLRPSMRLLTNGAGKPLSTKGSHNEIAVSRKLGSRVLQVAAYTDHLDHAAISGSGTLDAKDLTLAQVLADPTTETYMLAGGAYSGRGISVSLAQPLTQSLAATFGYEAGTALNNNNDGAAPLAEAGKGIGVRTTYAVSAAVRGKIVKTGTALRAEYRWQPEHTLTQVNAFNSAEREAYLGFYIRQRVWAGRFLPEGIDAVIEATNLLAQGYQPVLASDGHVLFLAQAPRAIQGGFAFNF